ncbi:MAG: GerMN domain-containing protein [Treponema sp.]|nr:GerMN domain-containing protein [Treponema sp.]
MVFFKQIRRLAYLVVLTVFAFIEMGHSGLSRRTFEFFSYENNRSVVEDRMLHKASSREANIKSYVEELILGPVSLDFAPLLTKGTKLRSFMYRNRVVYADFSREAALPIQGGKPLFDSFLTLNQGIRRNFSEVSDVKLFVNGNEVFFGEFSKFFSAE